MDSHSVQKEKRPGGKKVNRQDDSVQRHVNRTKQGKAAKSGETKPNAMKPTGTKPTGTKHTGTKLTGTRPTGTKSTATKPTGTKTTVISQGISGGHYSQYQHSYNTYAASTSAQMRETPRIGGMNPQYSPLTYQQTVTGLGTASKLQLNPNSTLYPHGQTRGYGHNVPGSGHTDITGHSQYGVNIAQSRYANFLYQQHQGIGGLGVSYSSRVAIQPNVGYSSAGTYSLRSPAQTHTQHAYPQMDVDHQGQWLPTGIENDHRNQPMAETEYQSSFGQASSQLAPVHNTHPLDENRHPSTHKSHGAEKHVEKQFHHTSSEYPPDQDRKNQEREEASRKKESLEEFDPIRDQQRGFHTDPSDEHRDNTTDDSSDHRHVGEGFQQQSVGQEKATNQRQRKESESDSRRTTQTEADQGVEKNPLIQCDVGPQRPVSRDFHSFKDKESFILHHCDVEHGTDPTVYIADLKDTSNDPENKVKKVEFGKKNSSCPEKVVMIVGSTGSGKSTMINAVVNYMFGIDWDDQYRLKLINEAASGHVVNQAVSQTGMITAYTIHHQPWFTVPYTLTIVDTPGFGDTGGLKRDKEIMDQIRKFFETQGSGGIDHIDGVGFVTQATMPRLTPTQRYIFDSILSIFGKDIAQNIFMLLTFADGQKPQVLSGLKEANMKYQDFYKFNNSALYVGGKQKPADDRLKGFTDRKGDASDEDSDDSDDDEDDESSFNQMFWRMGTGNFNRFMSDLENVKPQSLQLTAEVLQERNELEITVNKIQENIKVGLKKLDQLKMEQELLKHHQADIDRNRDFTYEVDELVIGTENLPPGESAINCSYCRLTCHFGKCKHLSGLCRAFNWANTCRCCPHKCNWLWHEKQPFRYVMETVKVTRTSSQLKQRYEKAKGNKLSAKQLIESCSEEFEVVQTVTLQLMEQARKCLKRLDEIALKPNPLSTTDYIDLMIQEEEFIAGPGWKVRQDNS